MVEVVMISKGFFQFMKATEAILAKISPDIEIDDEIYEHYFALGCSAQETVDDIIEFYNE
jgi:hypothetical protein